MAERNGTGGRPSKGKRDQLLSRVPWELGELVRDEADSMGLSVSDYIASVLARELGRFDLAPAYRRYQDEELPINAA